MKPGRMIARLNPLRERFDAVLLDLDGTLLSPWEEITSRGAKAVRALTAAGFQVHLCTGRSFTGIVPFAKTLGLDTALVAYNGAWIARPGDEPWRYAPIPDPYVAAVERLERDASFSFRHHGAGKLSLVREHPLYRRVADWYVDVSFVEHVDALPARDLMRLSCYFDDRDACDAAWAAVDPAAREHLHRETYPMAIFRAFVDTELQLCEIQRKSRGKAEVFDYLLDVHGIPSERVVAVGDHVNDITMLEKAGLGVAMGNAVPSVKAVADVVIGHHEDDGVAAWVEAGMPANGEPPR